MVPRTRESVLMVGGIVLYGSHTNSSSEGVARESYIRAMEQNESALNAAQSEADRGTSYMSRYSSHH